MRWTPCTEERVAHGPGLVDAEKEERGPGEESSLWGGAHLKGRFFSTTPVGDYLCIGAFC
jgi:hypothetical protein